MSIISNTARHASIYMVGEVLNRIVSFLMLPIYTQHLSPEDYGVVELLFITIDVLAILVSFGASYGIFRHYNLYSEQKDKDAVISTIALLFSFIYLLVSLAGVMMSDQLSKMLFHSIDNSFNFKLIFSCFFFQIFNIVSFCYLRLVQKSKLWITISVIKLILQLSLNIVFIVYLNMKVTGVLYGTLISSAVIGLSVITYTLRKVGFVFSPRLACKIIAFGAPFILAGLGDFILTFSDRYFLYAYASLAEVGIYSLAYKLGFVLWGFMAKPLFNTWVPKRFEIGEGANRTNLDERMFGYLNLLMISGGFYMALFSKDLFMIMSDAAYWEAYKLVPLVVLAYIIQSWSDYFKFGMVYKGKPKYIAIGTIIAAISMLICCRIMVPLVGMYGAAVATVVAFYVRFQFFYIMSQGLCRVKVRWSKSLFVLAFAGFIVVVSNSTHIDNVAGAISFHAMLGLVYFFIVFYSPVVALEERRYIYNMIRSFGKPWSVYSK